MKIKKFIEIDEIGLLIADNDIYLFDNSNPSFGLCNGSLYQYSIEENILYHHYKDKVEKSNYNPIEKVKDIADYLEYIL